MRINLSPEAAMGRSLSAAEAITTDSLAAQPPVKTSGHTVESRKPRSGEERRRRSRQKLHHMEAWGDPGGTATPMVCKVLDFSNDGAKLTIQCESGLPDLFFVRIGGVEHAARVVWRSGQRLGVEFQKALGI